MKVLRSLLTMFRSLATAAQLKKGLEGPACMGHTVHTPHPERGQVPKCACHTAAEDASGALRLRRQGNYLVVFEMLWLFFNSF